QSLRCEGDILRPGGGHITVAVTYTPLLDQHGRLVNIIVNVMDITRFREEEEMKSTFISIISHELKTPVALVKGYAQTLARPDAQWDPETARQGLQIIEEEADRLEALINNLLDVSRIQAGGLRLELADVNLRRLLERVAQDYRTQTDKHTIELDLPEAFPIILGDEERLRQVFTNLLSNAIKYSPQGGTIRIGGWVEGPAPDSSTPARVVIYVADEGIGIPEEDLPHIFERFYRVDSSLRRSTTGAGLGLFLIHAIVEAHQGEIWVHSELGKGTTFFVALPLQEESEDAP
ncbi:MAG: histidine kinase, partial [Caldilineae bacterium]